uniref:Hercynylcysteine sulfoxide lyase-like isoform X2 n=1 Tax=Crassostrea virginica TaxID=6565 RepID=A0A8B8E0T1_CRAVI|nr:hercynylcysteine sulfoxide lyase-like isoform X2 [Crassostrea virginica]
MDLSKIEFGARMKTECFHFEEGYIFVNHGAYGEVPVKIRDKQKQLLDTMNDNTGKYFREVTPRMYMEAITAAAAFLGADPNNLVLVQNATSGVNTVLRAFPWKQGDEILTTTYTYKAVQNTCHRMSQLSIGCKVHQFEIRFPISDESELTKAMTSCLDQNPNIKLAILDHITSSTALVFPLKKMIEECRKRGVLVLVDGAHAPGQMEIHLEELRPDFYTGDFHKWMYTPRGCAFLWVHKDHQGWCTPLVTSNKYKEGFQMEFCEQGTRDDIPYFLIPEAIQFYKDVGGMDKINRYKRELLGPASAMLAERLQTRLLEIPDSMVAPGMRLVLLPEYQGYPKTVEGSEKLFLDLTHFHKTNTAIFCVQGELYIRLSVNIYNEMADYERLAEVLCQLPRKH